MYDIGRICIKVAGRDAGNEAVIIDVLDDKFVMVDGNVRRRKCNIMHLEPSERKIDIKKGTSHEAIKKEFVRIGFPVWETKPRKTAQRPKKTRKKKKKHSTDKKAVKKEKDSKSGKNTEKDSKKENKKEKGQAGNKATPEKAA
ncbi:50S ribosomal protein L14e [Candidatus Woesearchaeota archaeon]|nr:50S ribosomal protein L14e [Candidatus Woesearchaeota archaeon]